MSTNINTYADVAAVLEQVIPVGHARYTLDNPGMARHWIQRAYKYRLLLQKQLASANTVKGYIPKTALDRMKLRCEGATVVIDLNPQITGRLSLPGGKVITPSVEPLATSAPQAPMAGPFSGPLFPDDDPMLEAARLLAEQHDED